MKRRILFYLVNKLMTLAGVKTEYSFTEFVKCYIREAGYYLAEDYSEDTMTHYWGKQGDTVLSQMEETPCN